MSVYYHDFYTVSNARCYLLPFNTFLSGGSTFTKLTIPNYNYLLDDSGRKTKAVNISVVEQKIEGSQPFYVQRYSLKSDGREFPQEFLDFLMKGKREALDICKFGFNFSERITFSYIEAFSSSVSSVFNRDVSSIRVAGLYKDELSDALDFQENFCHDLLVDGVSYQIRKFTNSCVIPKNDAVRSKYILVFKIFNGDIDYCWSTEFRRDEEVLVNSIVLEANFWKINNFVKKKNLCSGKYWVPEKRKYEDFSGGQFIRWAENYEEFDNGAGNFVGALVLIGKDVKFCDAEISFTEEVDESVFKE